MDSTALTKLEPQEMEARIETAAKQFGFSLDANGIPRALTKTDLAYLGQYCRDYGLDPLLGEVCLFHGRPYVMIDGLRRKAQETGQYAGLTIRPVVDREEKQGCGYEPHDIVFLATAKRMLPNGQVAEFTRYGAVTDAERKEMSRRGDTPRHPVLSKKPAEMAQNRAERHAIRTAFHFEFPGVEAEPSLVPEITVSGGPDDAETAAPVVEGVAVEGEYTVVPETGEIVEHGSRDEPPVEEPPGLWAEDDWPPRMPEAKEGEAEPSAQETEKIPSYGKNELDRRRALYEGAAAWGWDVIGKTEDLSRLTAWVRAETEALLGDDKRWGDLTAAEQNAVVHWLKLEGPNRHYEETK